MPRRNELEDLIDHQLIANEELTKRKVPEGVGYLINGNMCFGIFGKYLVLRNSEQRAKKLLREDGIQAFNRKDPSMKGWIMAEPEVYRNPKRLARLLKGSIEFTSGLPAQ